MTTATESAPVLSERLQQRIEEHKAEVARLREELGDPQEALSAFVREHFSLEALLPDDPSRPVETSLWLDDEIDGQDAR